MYLTLAQSVNDYTYELDQMITAKDLMINHSFMKFKSGVKAVGNPIYVRLDFIDTAQSFRIHHNPEHVDSTSSYDMYTGLEHASDLNDMRGLILVGVGSDSTVEWKDLYYNLVDSKRHTAIHIPKNIRMQVYYMDLSNNKLKLVPSNELNTVQLVFDVNVV